MALTKTLNRLKSDASLLRGFAKGDASAFESLYSRYKDQMFNHLCYQLGTHPEKRTLAEEIAQEVWMAVIRGAENFEDKENQNSGDKSSFPSWLFSIAHRRLADFWRQQYKYEENLATTEDVDQLTASEQEEPESSLFTHKFSNLIQQLPTEQRQSFLLREEGFSYREIAGIMECNAETVKSRLRYAKNTLRTWLEDKAKENESPDGYSNE